MSRPDDPRHTFIIEPVEAPERPSEESAARAAARRTAEAFGEVVGDSTTRDGEREVAFAFDARDPERAPGEALIVAGSPDLKGQILVAVPEDRAFSGLLLGKAIALTPPEQLVDDALVTVVAADVAPCTVRLDDDPHMAEDLGAERLLVARIEADPASPKRLIAGLERLVKLRELNAPESIIEEEIELIRRRYAQIRGAGWDEVSRPLPGPLQALLAEVAGGGKVA
jgi:hypothetical protein